MAIAVAARPSATSSVMAARPAAPLLHGLTTTQWRPSIDLPSISISSSDSVQCMVLLADADCEWKRGRCVTSSYSLAGKCVASNCGLINCVCVGRTSGRLLPWVTLNVSAAASASEIRHAYATAALGLRSDANPGCVMAARQASLAARRARDTMLALAPYISTHDDGHAFGEP